MTIKLHSKISHGLFVVPFSVHPHLKMLKLIFVSIFVEVLSRSLDLELVGEKGGRYNYHIRFPSENARTRHGNQISA